MMVGGMNEGDASPALIRIFIYSSIFFVKVAGVHARNTHKDEKHKYNTIKG